jgi:hypothetical protein
MRHRSLAAICLILAGTTYFHSQNVPAAPKTVAEAFDQSVSAAERATVALAEAMPENRYSFVPANGEFHGVRTFAQLAKHIAVANYLNGAALLGEKVPIDVGKHENGPDSVRSKAETVKFLRDSFLYLHKAMATVNERNLMEVLDLPEGGQAPRLSVVTAAISHPWDLYGQMIEYLRMNGIDPQKI